MTVDEASALKAECDGRTFYFCSDHCRQQFLSTPSNHETKPRGTLYTCPMHPEVEQDHPGDCPKCGMRLDAKRASAGTEDEENAELRSMMKRFWIGAGLTVPVFVLAMAHLVPALARQSWASSPAARWTQFVLATPVVWWGGWPFFQRGWRRRDFRGGQPGDGPRHAYGRRTDDRQDGLPGSRTGCGPWLSNLPLCDESQLLRWPLTPSAV